MTQRADTDALLNDDVLDVVAPIGAVLIDMDGTLVDSDRTVERIWRDWATTHGVDPEAVIAVCHGATPQATMRRFRPDLDDAAIEAQTQANMRRESVDVVDVVAGQGAEQLLRTLAGLGLPWAVVTNADRDLALARLGAAGVNPAVLVTVDEVPIGKPHPACYHLGAERVGVPIEDCLVVEDSDSGVAAGRAAGARVVGVRHEDADLRVEHLGELADLLQASRSQR